MCDLENQGTDLEMPIPGKGVKNQPVNTGDRELQFRPLGWENPWRRVWQPIPVFLPGESHGQSRLLGYRPWGCKDLDMSETTYHTCTLF